MLYCLQTTFYAYARNKYLSEKSNDPDEEVVDVPQVLLEGVLGPHLLPVLHQGGAVKQRGEVRQLFCLNEGHGLCKLWRQRQDSSLAITESSLLYTNDDNCNDSYNSNDGNFHDHDEKMTKKHRNIVGFSAKMYRV